MKVLNEYPDSHHYWEKYEKSDYFCPCCGSKELWEEQGSGDYYLGVDYVCTNCDTVHTLDNSGNEAKKEIVDQLKTKVTSTPTTKKGN